jgi:transposase
MVAPKEESCPDCGGTLRPLGEDVSEVLEYVPARFKVIRTLRPKLSCACCARIVQEPAPHRPIDKGLAGPGLLAHVLVTKYADHLPLYRQSESRRPSLRPLEASASPPPEDSERARVQQKLKTEQSICWPSLPPVALFRRTEQ